MDAPQSTRVWIQNSLITRLQRPSYKNNIGSVSLLTPLYTPCSLNPDHVPFFEGVPANSLRTSCFGRPFGAATAWGVLEENRKCHRRCQRQGLAAASFSQIKEKKKSRGLIWTTYLLCRRKQKRRGTFGNISHLPPIQGKDISLTTLNKKSSKRHVTFLPTYPPPPPIFRYKSTISTCHTKGQCWD